MSRMPKVVSAAPRLQAKAQAERHDRRMTALRRIAWALAAVVPLAVLGWVVLGTSLLGVSKVLVSGEHRLTAEQVQSAADVPKGTPLARIDTSAVARRVRALDAVASVTVTRSWPNTLKVTVIERTAAVAVQDGAKYDLLDSTGVQFDSAPTPPRGVVRLQATGDARTAALTVLTGLPTQLRRAVWIVRAASPQEVSLVLRGNRVLVWGSATDGPAKAAAAVALLKLPGHVYDVSSPTVVTRR